MVQAPYLLLPVGLGVILTYLLSHLLVRYRILPKRIHRKIWNTLLLLTFLITAILGLLLAIQINYKLEWEFVDKFLVWHVNFGIAMAMVALMHLLWHIDYYLHLFKKPASRVSLSASTEAVSVESGTKNSRIIWLTGFSATIIQVLLLRELTTLFQGNEIMMSWTLGIWMVVTGSGSLSGIRLSRSANLIRSIPGLLSLITTLPFILIILLDIVKKIIFLPGIMINPWQYIILVIVFLFPICFFSGLLFSLFVSEKSREPGYFAKVYIYEALGSIAGGILVSFLLIQWLTVVKSLVIVSLIASAFLYINYRRYNYLILLIFQIFILIALFYFPVEKKLRSLDFSVRNVVLNKETYFGNLMIAESGGEYNFFLNGSLLYNTGNYIQREEFVHFAMLQHPRPEQVLLVSGSAPGMVREILKYPEVERIDFVENNRNLVRAGRQFDTIPEIAKLHLHITDINEFIRKSKQKYDVVIFATPDPSSVQLNRYYSAELISSLKKRLTPEAVVIFGMSPTGNYMSRYQQKRLSVVYNTLGTLFANVLIIPGEQDYLLASNAMLNINIGELCSSRDLGNYYVNQDYIDDVTLLMRSEQIRQQIDKQAGINRADRALPVFYSTLKYLSQFSNNSFYLLVFPLLAFLILLLFMKGELKGMYVAGMTGASLEVMLIFSIQIAFGYIYAVIGILIALFMTGLTIGAYAGLRFGSNVKSYRLAFVLLIFFLVFLWLFFSVRYTEWNAGILWPVYILSMLFPSVLVGYIFVAATRMDPLEKSISAPKMYTVDLLGSALGVMIVTLILIPVLGLRNCCIFLILLNTIPLSFSLISHTDKTKIP